VPIVRVEVSSTCASPNDWRQAHCFADGPYTVVDITVRRSHGVWGYPGNIFDRFLGPAQLCYDFLRGQGSERGMRPRMYGELVTAHILCLEYLRARDGAGADNEESGLEILLVEILK
jgi:hypothetical protein